MKVAVTGGAGYVGAVLVPMLLEHGHRVTVLDSFRFGAYGLLPVVGDQNLEVSKGDIRNRETVGRFIDNADVVFNLAAIVGHPACSQSPVDAVTTNVDGVRTIALQVKPHQMLIQASTGSVYGDIGSDCSEETPIKPVTVYGKTKAEAEAVVLERGGVPLRFATLFGVSPLMRLDLLINRFTYQAFHDGTLEIFQPTAQRSFLHVRDAARAFIFAMENYAAMAGRVFNVGDKRLNCTKLEIADKIARELPLTIHIQETAVDPDKRDYSVRYSRIRHLGFTAETGLEDGIRELIKVAPIIGESSLYRNGRP